MIPVIMVVLMTVFAFHPGMDEQRFAIVALSIHAGMRDIDTWEDLWSAFKSDIGLGTSGKERTRASSESCLEETKALKEEKLKQEEKCMCAIVDGVKEKAIAAAGMKG